MKALFKKEFLDVIRDKRTIISMIIIPVFGIPLLMIIMGGIMRKSVQELAEKRYKIGVYEKTQFKKLMEILERANFKIIRTSSPESLLYEKEIDAGIVVDKKNEKFKIQLIYAVGRETSEFAKKKLEDVLNSLKEKIFKEKLKEKGVKPEEIVPFILSEKSIQVGKGVFGFIFGTFLGYIIVILMVTSAMYPAIDLITGEKERRTLEILLSSPAGVNRVIISKILVVTVVSFIAAVLTLISLSITLLKGGELLMGLKSSELLMGKEGEQFSFLKMVNLKDIFILLTLIIPFSFLISSVEIAITSYARSYKEAQSLLTPLSFAVIIPAFYSFVPALSFSDYHFLIPVLNIAVTIKKLLQGEFVLKEYLITLFSNLLYMIFAFIYTLRNFKREKIIFRV